MNSWPLASLPRSSRTTRSPLSTPSCSSGPASSTQSDYQAGCPIVAAALEGNRAPGARAQAAATFNNWEQLLAEALAKSGVDPDRARSLATLIIAAIEGAVVLARAQQSTEPFERVARELRTIAAAILPQHEP